MHFLKSLSMQNKIIFSLIPMIICSMIVSGYIYKEGTKLDDRLEKSILITKYAAMQELQMVIMSEALRGYILDPKDTKEFDRKKKADQEYADLANKLAGITVDSKEIHDLNAAMAELDATELDKAENQLGDLVPKENQAVTLEYFNKTYSPIRAKQVENFEKLKKLLSAYNNTSLLNLKNEKKDQADMTIIFLMGSVLLGFSFTFFIIRSVNNSAFSYLENMYSITNELSSVAEKLSHKSQELSEATSGEASAIQETSVALQQVSAMVQNNTDSVVKSRELSTLSKAASNRGMESVQTMILSMKDININQEEVLKQVNEGNKKIGDIVSLISAIGDKTKVINDIVFQTKLLSFNASVEAARAGEQGKGFSVVADEVGKLAEMSGKAALEITTMLDESIRRVSSIVNENKNNIEKIVRVGKDKISQGTQTANACATSFEDVAQKINAVDNNVESISMASTEQSKGIFAINSAVSDLDKTTQQNSVTAIETFNYSKSMLDESKNLRGAVDNLVELFKGKRI